MARKKGDIAVEILQVFSEHRDRVLTTQEISEKTGIHKSSVSRCLKRLSEMYLIEKVKAGHYRIADSEEILEEKLSRKWTIEDNKRLIDKLLNIHDRLQVAVAPSVLMASNPEHPEYATSIRMMKALTDSGDMLLSRWNKINKGYDANPEQARQDALSRKRSEPPREEEKPQRVGHWDMEKKKMIK